MNNAEENATTAEDSQSGSKPGGIPEKLDFGFVFQRVKDVCTKPVSIWDTVKAEQDSLRAIFLGYVLLLAAIPVVAQYLKMITVGMSVPFVGTFRWPVFPGLVASIIQYALGVLMVFVLGFIVEKLSQYFGGNADLPSGVKIVAYAMTPAWAAGVLNLIPYLGILTLFAFLYGIYLLWQGIPAMTGVPQEKRLLYFISVVVVSVVVGLALGIVAAIFQPSMPTAELKPSRFMQENVLDNPDTQKIMEGLGALQQGLEGMSRGAGD